MSTPTGKHEKYSKIREISDVTSNDWESGARVKARPSIGQPRPHQPLHLPKRQVGAGPGWVSQTNANKLRRVKGEDC